MIAYVKRFVRFVDCHPRTGWYIAAVVTANLIVSVFNLIH